MKPVKSHPFISAVLVWPEDGISGVSQEQAVSFIGSQLHLVKVTDDEQEAMQMLEDGDVDVVQIVPQPGFPSAGGGARPEIQMLSRTVDPQVEAWIRSLSYAETNYINQQLLYQEARLAKEKAEEKYADLAQFQAEFQRLSDPSQVRDIEKVSATINGLRGALAELARILPPESLAQAHVSPELSRLYQNIRALSDDLDSLDQAIRSADLPAQRQRLSRTAGDIENLRAVMDQFIAIPIENLVTPVQDSYTNLRGGPYSLVIFYAPSVLALLVQQLAITLAALGLVRERQMGSYEMFRVSPLSFSQIILGKSLAYILYVMVSGVILTALLVLLKVPLPAYPFQFLALLLLVSAASVGIGLLISPLSSTDSQAIQLTMIMLLLSIFFTGFFMPLTGFAWPAWIVALLLPMSYAIEGFQFLMLQGNSPMPVIWIGLAVVTVLAYGLTAVYSPPLIMRRQYRKALD